MPLFACPKCGAVENTALGHYWAAVIGKGEACCSECHTGKWHGRFPKEPAGDEWVEEPEDQQVVGGSLPRFITMAAE